MRPGGPQGTPPPPSPPGQQAVPRLIVSGCSAQTVSQIIKGPYIPTGNNHGKPVYKKEAAGQQVQVLIYYWDGRNGDNLSGWWFGPEVGGDQVWAHNPSKEMKPPMANWRVPWDGGVDAALRITYSSPAPAGVGGGPIKPIPAGDPVELRRREEEKKKMLEDARRRQVEREAEQVKRAQELKQKREEEETKRKEQAAALAVRKFIQKVRVATPENYDELRSELEKAQETHIEAMGSLAEKVSQEAEQALNQAQKRIDDIQTKRAQDELNRVEAERKRQEQAELLEKTLKEAVESVQGAVDKTAHAEEYAKSHLPGTDATPEVMGEFADQLEAVTQAATDALEAASSSLSTKQKEIGELEAGRTVRKEVNELYAKLSAVKRSAEKLVGEVKTTRERVKRLAAQARREQEKKELFAKFDNDMDGKLSHKEVLNYCKTHLNFDLEKEVLERIFRSLGTVTFEKFRSLHQKTSIAKSEQAARVKRQEEAARLQKLEEERQQVRQVLEEVGHIFSAAERFTQEAEIAVKPLRQDTELLAEGIKETATTVESLIHKVEQELATALSKLEAIQDRIVKDPSHSKKEGHMLNVRKTRINERLTKVTAIVKGATEGAKRKALAILDQLRSDVAAAVREDMASKGKSGPELFDSLNGGNAVGKEAFVTFLQAHSTELAKDKAEELTGFIAGGEGTVSKERFLDFIRVYFRCVKATVLSEEVSIKSKTVRRLEIGEILEGLEGPSLDDQAGVKRVKCKAVEDQVVGWVTLAGNQGTPFLMPGANVFTCVQETPMTDGLSIEESQPIRRIAKGEVIEVIEFPQKDPTTDSKRIKGKAKLDDAVGWVTVSSNQGAVFLEHL